MLFAILLIAAIFEKVTWTIGGIRISLFMIVGVAFFFAELLKNGGKFSFDLLEKRIILAKLALLGYVIFQIITIEKGEEMNNQYTKGIISLVIEFLVIFAIIDYIHRKSGELSFKKIINLMFGVCSINTIYCIIQRINPQIDELLIRTTHSTVTRYGLDAYGQIGRITGLFTDSSNNGVFLVLTLLVIYLFLDEKNRTKSEIIIAKIIGVLTIVSLVLTFSFTAYVGVFILVIGYFIHNNLRKQLYFLLGIVGAIAIFIYVYSKNIAVAEILNDKIARLFITFTNNRNGIQEASHIGLIFYSLEIWSYSIITMVFGTGYNCMNIYFDKLFGLTGYKAHNFYLQNLAELGFLGFTVFAYYLRCLYKLIDNGKSRSAIIKTFFFALLIMNFTYDSMAQNMFYLVIFLLVAYHESHDNYAFEGRKM